jgi:MFS family permease
MTLTALPTRAAAWVDRWAAILPLLAAEFILWTGFGALLPVMPLYFTQHGVDVRLLGVVIAAWPAARLVAEPIFGALADRFPRIPMMVAGLLVAASAVGAMAIWTGPAAFVILRALSGLGTAMYDPAARGYLNDAAPADRKGEVFGLYNSAQMGGILLGPAIGGLGTALVGSYTFVLALASVTTFAAAVAVVLRVREVRGGRAAERGPASTTYAEFPGDRSPTVSRPGSAAGASAGPVRSSSRAASTAWAGPPATLRNRFILAAILINVAGYFGGGLYETIWALFVTEHGGGVELIGATFAVFGLTTILLSPIGGRVVDRVGPFPFVVGGLLVMISAMFAYPFIGEPLLYVPLVAFEAVGFSFLGPATFLVIARGTPEGRSSTAQGLLGAAGTIGTIAAAVGSGLLAAIDLNTPFFAGSAILTGLLLLTLIVGGGPLRSMQPATR